MFTSHVYLSERSGGGGLCPLFKISIFSSNAVKTLLGRGSLSEKARNAKLKFTLDAKNQIYNPKKDNEEIFLEPTSPIQQKNQFIKIKNCRDCTKL